jgi:cytochrome c553
MNATRILAAVAIALASIAPAFAASPEPPAGASSCTGCHAGAAGVDTPVSRLAGRDAAEIVSQMQALKVGKQASTVMERIAKGFSDEEIRAIASWYAGQR